MQILLMLFLLAHIVTSEMEWGNSPSQRAVEAGALWVLLLQLSLVLCRFLLQVFYRAGLSFVWSLLRRSNFCSRLSALKR